MSLFKAIALVIFSLMSYYAFAQIDTSTTSIDYSIYSLPPGAELPRFPGCENRGLDLTALTSCSQNKLYSYIFQSLTYPTKARYKGIEGMVVVSFIIEKDGTLSFPQLIKTIGGGCDEEVMRIVNGMNKNNIKWIPGKLDNETVRVQFNLPVKFQLEGKKKKKKRNRKILRTRSKSNSIPQTKVPFPPRQYNLS